MLPFQAQEHGTTRKPAHFQRCGSHTASFRRLTQSHAVVELHQEGGNDQMLHAKHDLQPPLKLQYFNADGFQMSDTLGRDYLWWQVVPGMDRRAVDSYLLLWKHCKGLSVAPKDFPRQIPMVWYTASMAHVSTSNALEAAAQGYSEPAPTTNLPQPKSPPLPLHNETCPSATRAYFLNEYSDVLLRIMPLKAMAGAPKKIHLGENVQQFPIHIPQLIPLTFRDSIKKELDSMVAQGIIASVGDNPFP